MPTSPALVNVYNLPLTSILRISSIIHHFNISVLLSVVETNLRLVDADGESVSILK